MPAASIVSRRPALTVAVAQGISAAGSGLAIPFLAIYLVNEQHITSVLVGGYFALVAMVNIVAAVPAGRWVDRIGPKRLCLIGGMLQTLGQIVLAAAPTESGIVGAAVASGVGNALFYAALNPVMISAVAAEERPRVFATRNVCVNIGYGVGAAVAGLTASQVRHIPMQLLLSLNAASCLVLAVATFLVAKPGKIVIERARTTRTAAGAPGAVDGGSRRLLVRLAAVQVVVYLTAFSQLETSTPVLIRNRLDQSLTVVSAVFVINTIVVAFMQMPVHRLATRWSARVSLGAAAVFWAASWVSVVGAAAVGSVTRIALLLLFPVLLATGECFYGISFHPLVAKLAPPSRYATWNSVMSSSMNLANVVGAAAGVAVIATVAWVAVPIAALIGGCIVLVLAATLRPAARGDGIKPMRDETSVGSVA